MGFACRQMLPGVYHIQDAMGVCMTLLTGRDSMLLIDTGYGMENVCAYVHTLCDLPLRVLLTHGHHDHALGSRWFEEVLLFKEDREVFDRYTGPEQRAQVLEEARDRGIDPGEDYLASPMARIRDAREGAMDLGGMTVQIRLCPGHTPGSAVLYVPERRLLLTGDNWNPCTWLFFPEALPLEEYRRNMHRLLFLPFEQILCPHRMEIYPRAWLERFLAGLTKEAVGRARPTQNGAHLGILTEEIVLPDGQNMVFDALKAEVKA